MAFVKGIVTCCWYRKAPESGATIERSLAAAATPENAFRPIAGIQRERVGWVDPADLTVAPTIGEKTTRDRFLFVDLRRDSRKPHPAIFRVALKKALAERRNELDESGRGRGSAKLSKDEVEEVFERVVDELIADAPTAVSVVPVLVDFQLGDVFVGTSSDSKCALVEDRVRSDLELDTESDREMVPVTPASLAADMMERGVDEFGDGDPGAEFLLWLVYRSRSSPVVEEVSEISSQMTVSLAGAAVVKMASGATRAVRVSGPNLSDSRALLSALSTGGVLESLSIDVAEERDGAKNEWRMKLRARDFCVSVKLPVFGEDSVETRFVRASMVSDVYNRVIAGLFASFLSTKLDAEAWSSIVSAVDEWKNLPFDVEDED